MKRCIFCLLGLMLFFGTSSAQADFYSDACQAILLKGKVELPEKFPKDEPLQLTLSYQMNFQKAPSFLMIKLPTGATEYEVSIVGFRKKEPKDYEIPQIFWYPRGVTFRYWVQSQEGDWKSATQRSEWHPAASKVEDVVDCDPTFYLNPLKLERGA